MPWEHCERRHVLTDIARPRTQVAKYYGPILHAEARHRVEAWAHRLSFTTPLFVGCYNFTHEDLDYRTPEVFAAGYEELRYYEGFEGIEHDGTYWPDDEWEHSELGLIYPSRRDHESTAHLDHYEEGHYLVTLRWSAVPCEGDRNYLNWIDGPVRAYISFH
jgi:hypothetical protein